MINHLWRRTPAARVWPEVTGDSCTIWFRAGRMTAPATSFFGLLDKSSSTLFNRPTVSDVSQITLEQYRQTRPERFNLTSSRSGKTCEHFDKRGAAVSGRSSVKLSFILQSNRNHALSSMRNECGVGNQGCFLWKHGH